MVVRRCSILAVMGALALVTSAACSSVPDITFADVDGGPGGGGDGGPCAEPRPGCSAATCSAPSSCVDGAPSDWTVIAFAEASRTPCPDGFGGSTDVRTVVGASGASDCTCACGALGTCASGKVTLAFGADATCSGATESISAKSGCEKLAGAAGFSVSANTFVKATPPAAACNATPTSSLTPLRDGRTCALAGETACSSPSSCAPSVSGGYAICVQKAGVNSCPSAFPKARRSGTAATDSRACSACTCTSSPCSVDIKLHEGVNCGSTKATFKTSGTCAQITNGAFTANSSEATATGGCAVATAPQASGTLSFVGESTICCK